MSDDTSAIASMNEQLVLIGGYSATGKSASLRNIQNQERWLYLNSESGKRLPFRNKFMSQVITDPFHVLDFMDQATENKEHVDGVIIDSLTFLMDMFESQYVLGTANTMKAWSDFAQYFKNLLQVKIPTFGKPVIITAHFLDIYDEASMSMKTGVPIKGSLKNNGVEAYFSTVVSAKKVPITELEKYKSKLLTITDEERELGYKHVFQTRPTKATIGERIRSPMGLFDKDDTYMDNDAALLLKHLHEYYN